MPSTLCPLDEGWWGIGSIGLGYELEIYAGSGGWPPHIEIEHPSRPLTYHFVQSFDDPGAFTPGYAVCPGGLTDALFDTGVYSMPDELPVEPWMPAAIERAGFDYDPVPNSERRDAGRDESWRRRDQPTLGEVVG